MYRILTLSDASSDPSASKSAGSRDDEPTRPPRRGFAVAEAPDMGDDESQSDKYPMWIRLIVITGSALGSWALVYALLSLF